MKVLSVIPMMGAGGAESVVTTLAEDAVSRGDEVVVASSGGFRADLLARRGVFQVQVRMDDRRIRTLARSARALRSHVRRSRPDLVHAHNVKAAVLARLAVGRAVPVLTTLHGVATDEYAGAARLLRWCTDEVVAVSPHVARSIVGAGFPERRTRVVANAVPQPSVHDRATARRRLGLPVGAPVALCLARLAAQKRHDLLLNAWAGDIDGAHLLVAGDGPTRGAIESATLRLGLRERVHLLGERDDVDWLLSAADLVVLPTDWEGLPVSLLEAMAVGVPVVVSRVGDLAETLGCAVRLVEPGSAAALRHAIRDLLTDERARADLGARGRELVTTRHATGPMLRAYRDAYDQLLGGAR
jgi:glycosyltransferase involved in cell wall biosynthesis